MSARIRQERACGKWLVRFDYPDIEAEIRLIVKELPLPIGKRIAEGKIEKLVNYGYTEVHDVMKYDYSGYEYFHIPRDKNRDYIAGCVVCNEAVCVDLSCRRLRSKPPLFRNLAIYRINQTGGLR